MILVKKYWFPLVVIALLVSIFLGYHKFSERETLKRELNLDGLFVNVKDVKIGTEETSYFENKPYKKIIIRLPSLSSELDDQTVSDSNKKETPNQIIDREKFDKEFTKWLKSIFDKNVAQRYTKRIEVWYRDMKIIDEKY